MSEWKTKTLAEHKDDNMIWRAQLLKPPEGKTLLSLRKFVVKKDGSEQITRQGISFPMEGKAEIKAVAALLKTLYQKAK